MRKLAMLSAVVVAGGLFAASPAVAQGTGDNAAFCKATVDLVSLFNNEPDEDAPAKQLERFEAKVADHLEKVTSSAPPEVAESVNTISTTITDPNTPDDPFELPEFATAYNAIGEYVYNSCGYQQVDVTMLEYEFQGFPETLDTGTTVIKLTNTGAEFHDMALARFKSGISAKRLLRLPEAKAEKNAEFVGFGFAPPGEVNYIYVKLAKPGRYLAACFVPVGATPDAGEEVDGPPHHSEGMYTTFEAEKA